MTRSICAVLLTAACVTSAACAGPQPAVDAALTTEGAAPAATSGTAPVAAPAAAPVAAPVEAARPAPPPAPEYREVTVPAGTSLALELESSVAYDTSLIEDSVQATLRQPIVVGGDEVLPAGTEVVGAVTNADDSGRVKGRAAIAFQFTSLRHDGTRYDIRTTTISRRAPATKAKDATKIGIGAGAGAALGALLGGGDGAAKGAAIGGAAGTGVVLATKGKEVRLGPGADVATKLTAPLTVRVRVRG